jgi:hypothetical protein
MIFEVQEGSIKKTYRLRRYRQKILRLMTQGCFMILASCNWEIRRSGEEDCESDRKNDVIFII